MSCFPGGQVTREGGGRERRLRESTTYVYYRSPADNTTARFRRHYCFICPDNNTPAQIWRRLSLGKHLTLPIIRQTNHNRDTTAHNFSLSWSPLRLSYGGAESKWMLAGKKKTPPLSTGGSWQWQRIEVLIWGELAERLQFENNEQMLPLATILSQNRILSKTYFDQLSHCHSWQGICQSRKVCLPL